MYGVDCHCDVKIFTSFLYMILLSVRLPLLFIVLHVQILILIFPFDFSLHALQPPLIWRRGLFFLHQIEHRQAHMFITMNIA